MNIKDIELYVVVGKGHVNIVTKRKERLTDGVRHPVKVIKPERKEEPDA